MSSEDMYVTKAENKSHTHTHTHIRTQINNIHKNKALDTCHLRITQTKYYINHTQYTDLSSYDAYNTQELQYK